MWHLLVEGFVPECRARDSGADARRSAQPAERNDRKAQASRGSILTLTSYAQQTNFGIRRGFPERVDRGGGGAGDRLARGTVALWIRARR